MLKKKIWLDDIVKMISSEKKKLIIPTADRTILGWFLLQRWKTMQKKKHENSEPVPSIGKWNLFLALSIHQEKYNIDMF